MKRVVSIVCVAVLLFSAVCLAGCGMNGTYKLVGETYLGYSVNISDANGIMTIDGNTAAFTGVDYISDGAAVVDDKTKTFTEADGDTWTYSKDGKRLTLRQNNTTLVFEKQ